MALGDDPEGDIDPEVAPVPYVAHSTTQEVDLASDWALSLRWVDGEVQCDPLRCIACVFGNPFRLVTLAPSVLAWNDRLVVRLAQAIYEERRWGDMPILGDALLDAGCDNDEVVAHCRAGGEHVRGCWVIDLLLDKE